MHSRTTPGTSSARRSAQRFARFAIAPKEAKLGGPQVQPGRWDSRTSERPRSGCRGTADLCADSARPRHQAGPNPDDRARGETLVRRGTALRVLSRHSDRSLRPPSDVQSSRHRVDRLVWARVRFQQPGVPGLQPLTWPLRTSTGSLVDGADTAARVLASAADLG